MSKYKFLISFLSVFLLLTTINFAQLELPRLSPQSSVSQTIGNTDINVVYCSPRVKGRVIYGDLVQYNEVWRSGANEATTVEFSTDVTVEGHKVPAGKYSFFTIPNKEEWTVVLNKVWDQWGAFNYDESKDLLRFKIEPVVGESLESLAYYFSDIKDNSGTLNLAWEKITIPIDIKVDIMNPKKVQASPHAKVYKKIGYTDVTIDYHRPGVKGREIWGKLVPYNKVWRTGANNATTIELSTGVTINGNDVPAGKYALFTIPSENEWTVILNKNADQWGAADYDQSRDLLRFKVKPEKNDFRERMMFWFGGITEKSADAYLDWKNLRIPFTISVDVNKQTYNTIKEALKNVKSDDWQTYSAAAGYAAEHNVFVEDALDWTNKGLSINEHYSLYFVKAKLYKRMGKYSDALKSIEKCREAGRDAKNYEYFLPQVNRLENQIKSDM